MNAAQYNLFVEYNLFVALVLEEANSGLCLLFNSKTSCVVEMLLKYLGDESFYMMKTLPAQSKKYVLSKMKEIKIS